MVDDIDQRKHHRDENTINDPDDQNPRVVITASQNSESPDLFEKAKCRNIDQPDRSDDDDRPQGNGG